jgi:uncharacterized protein (DUF58 family)
VAERTADPDITRRGLQLTGLAAGLLVLGASSLLLWFVVQTEAQVVLGCALLLAVVIDVAVAWHWARPLHVELHNPIDAHSGEPLVYVVRLPDVSVPTTVTGPRSSPWLPPPSALVDSRAPGTMALVAPPRGVVHYLLFELRTRSVLGTCTVRRTARAWCPVPLHVGPLPIPHAIEWPALRSTSVGPTEVAPRGDDETRGLRPYVRGDAPRSVHWAASAHHGSLMVREREGTGVLALRIVVHLRTPGPASEAAAARAAWLAEEGIARGWLVRLVTLDVPPQRPHPPALDRVRPNRIWTLGSGSTAPTTARTTVGQVRSRRDISRRLAVVGYGHPDLEPWGGLTRLITTDGDEWL